MKKTTLTIICLCALAISGAFSQDLKAKDVPPIVKSALNRQFPKASKVSWEKEKGNFEANWGGKSGEDNSAQFTPDGNFIERVENTPVSSLPVKIAPYVSAHYNGAKIREAGRLTDAAGKHSLEVEIKGKDLVFDLDGNFIKESH